MNARSMASIALTLLLLSAALVADDQVPEGKLSKELIGTWRLVSAKYGGRESDIAKRLIVLKHITPTHHTWMRIRPDSGEVITMAGGRWSMEGGKFSTTTEFGMGGPHSTMIGNAHTFTCRIVGNRWYHAGKLQEFNLDIEEVWERQQPQEGHSSVDGSTK